MTTAATSDPIRNTRNRWELIDQACANAERRAAALLAAKAGTPQ